MEVSEVTAEVDRLHITYQWREAYHYLEPYTEKTREPEILWRLIRSCYFFGKYFAKDAKEKECVSQRGLEVSKRALMCKDHTSCHAYLWSGVFLSWQSGLVGLKSKIEKSLLMKEYFDKALAIDASNAEVHYSLGRWCFEVSSVGWVARKAAQAVVGKIDSSYEEALRYFLTAEDISPGFFTGNWLYLAKTYYQLGNYAEALKWARKLVAYEAEHLEDVENVEAAKEILKKFTT